MKGKAARVVIAALAVASVVVAPMVVVAWAAAQVMIPGSESLSGQPADAVVALAGESARLHVADEIADATGGVLTVSWVPGSDPERDERCGDNGSPVLCFRPFPVSTAGEARAIGDLAADRGWERIVVVTSRYHVGRAEMLVGQCVDGAHVHVVSATERLTGEHVLEETLAVVAGMTVHRAC